MVSRNPKVSVCLITYNHENYIEQAIESVLMQRTNFDYEIIIGEDDSEDRTREIVVRYAEKYPEKIKLLLNDRANVIYINGKPTGRWNLINNLSHANGEYIALCDGDDYWTDHQKLQKQVDFMINHQQCVMCAHPTQMLFNSTGKIGGVVDHSEVKEVFTLNEFLRETNFIQTCSVLVKNWFHRGFPDWFLQIPCGDLAIYALSALHGDIGFINEVMAVYRIHEGGVHSSLPPYKRFLITVECYKILSNHLEPRYHDDIRLCLLEYGCQAFGEASEIIRRGRYREAIPLYFLAFRLNSGLLSKLLTGLLKQAKIFIMKIARI